MKLWEQKLETLKQALSESEQRLTASFQDLDGALRDYQRVIDAGVTERELLLLRSVDIELAKASFNRDAVLELIVRGAAELSDAQYGDLLLPADAQNLRVESSTRPSLVGRLIPIAGSVTGEAFRTAEVQTVQSISTAPKYHTLIQGMASEIAIPLLEGGHRMGVLNIESTEPHKFTDHHSTLLTTLAGQAAIALRNSRLHSEFTALIETQGRILSNSGSLRDMLSHIGTRARSLLNAEGCQLLSYSNNGLSIESLVSG